MPDRLSRLALGWFGLTTIVFWLPTVRGAFDGPSYQWALIGFSGRALGGDYWFPQHIEASSWHGRNWRWLGALAGALPLRFALLRFGTPNSLADQVGVIITIIQWLLVGRVFRIYAVAQADERARQAAAFPEVRSSSKAATHRDR